MVKVSAESKVVESAPFRSLVRRRWLVSAVLSIVIVGAYFTFILIIALRKDLFAVKEAGSVPLGIPAGVGLILLAWVLTGIYIAWANFSYDGQVRKLREEIQR